MISNSKTREFQLKLNEIEASRTISDGKLQALETRIYNKVKELYASLDTEKKELLTKIDGDHGRRIKIEDSLRSLIAEVKQDVDQQNVTFIRESLATLRREFDDMNNQLVEPNRTFFGSLGCLYVVVVQVQQLLESLNQNTNTSPLEFNWAFYLADLLESESKESGSRKPNLA